MWSQRMIIVFIGIVAFSEAFDIVGIQHRCIFKRCLNARFASPIGLYHPLDGITDPKYKLLHFLTTNFFCKEKKAIAFNRDRCCHLALCLRLILFHFAARMHFRQQGGFLHCVFIETAKSQYEIKLLNGMC